MKRSSLSPASAVPSAQLSTLTRCIRLALGIAVTSAVFNPVAFAEGTKQWAPASNHYAALGVMETGSAQTANYPFAGYDQPADNRLYIHISDPANEVIYIGLGSITGNAGDAKTDNYYWRIKAPDGTIVKTASLAGGAASNITSHAQAIAGPDVLNPSGYSTAGGWTFDPAAAGKGAGDYYIEFDLNNNASTVGAFTDTYNGTTYTWGGGLNINWFDITVASKGTSPAAIDGRVWSKNWGVRTNDPAVFPTAPFGTPFNGSMFAYDSNGYVTKIDFLNSGLRPLQGQFSLNKTGTGVSGVKATDRKSVMNANATTPLHKIFLNQPDTTVYPLGAEGQLQNLPLKVSDPGNTKIQVDVTQPGQVEIVLDFGNDGSYTAGVDRRLFADVVAGTNQVAWDGKNGAGANVTAAQFPIQTMVAYTQGETHFTAYDVEGLDSGFKVYTQTTSGTTGPNLQFWDDSNITQVSGVTPTVLTNTDTGAATRQTWNYVSADMTTGYGNSNTINTWWFAYRDYQTSILRAYNTVPVATNDTASTNEDTVLNGTTVLANDTDANGDTLTVNTTPVTAPTHGTLALKADGTYTYTPAANFSGSDSFTYEISDGNGGTATATVTITVAPVNDPPVANDDTTSTPENTVLNGTTVLVNDTDVEGQALTVNTTPVAAPAHGSLTLKADGTYTYTPANGYNGTDSFTYEVSDSSGGKDTAVVTITIAPVNDPPLASDDTATTAEDTVLNGTTLLANDTDPDGDTLTVSTTPVVAPAHGTLALKADGTYTYTPDKDYNGTDTFTYQVSDGSNTDTATVTLTITSVNDAPNAVDDTASTAENTALNGTTLLANDTDLDGDTLTVTTTPVVAPTHGSLALKADGTYTYTPDAGYNGTDTFTYEISDGQGGKDTAVVTLTVSAVNDAPLASDDTATTAEDTALNGTTILGNDTDPDGDTLTVNTTPVAAPAHGSLTLKADGTYTYTPTKDFNGTDSFTYEVSDGNGGKDTAVVTITVTPANDTPVAMDDTATTLEDTTLNGTTVLANDTDVDGDTLNVNTTPVTPPAHGTLALKADGTYTYTPDANFNGTDSFTYEVSDGKGGTDTATVTLTIGVDNDAPVATDDTATTAEDTVLNGTTVLGNDSDLDGDTLTVNTTPVAAPAHGTVTLKADSTYTYTPAKDFNGTDSFSYQVTDGNGGMDTATVTITVTPVNDTPDAVNDTATVSEDGVLNGSTVLTNDNDLDGDTLTVNTTPVTPPAHGTLVIKADGTYTYTPSKDFNGTDSFTYEISDGNGGKDTATVTLTVTPANDAPLATDDTATTAEDTVLNGSTILGNDSDIDGDSLSVNTTPTVAPAHGTLVLKTDGTYTYTPAKDFNGTDSFTYEVSDGNGGTDTASVTITVSPTNDAPVAMDDSASLAEDTVFNGSTVLANDSDIDGDTLTVTTTLVTAPAHGTLTLKTDGTYTYTPAKDFNGTDSFSYEVSDGNGGKATATVNLTITPVNDAPLITSTNNVTFAENGTGTALDVQSTDDSDAETSGLTYSLLPMFDASLFNIDPATGAISFKAPPDYEAPKDSNADNAYILMTKVCDSGNLCNEQVEVIVVTNVQETSPPQIISTVMKTPENQTFVTSVAATDPDANDTLTFSIKGGADANLFSIDPVTGDLSFKTAPDFEAPADANHDNVYEVIVGVTDNTAPDHTDEQALKVTVTDVQENTAPAITSDGAGDTASISLAEDQPTVTTVQANDAEGDTLTYSISGGDDAALFQIDPATGKLSFIAAPDFENPADTNADNQYAVTVSVKDKAGLTDTQALTISVTNGADIKLQVRGFLQGAYASQDGLMKDSLRTLGLIPAAQPYGETGTPFAYKGTETAAPAQLALTGNNAPVDWVLVELRDPATPKTRVAAIAGLLQRDGDVVDATTGSPSLILEGIPVGQYYVTLRHRNHLGVTTATPKTLSSTPASVDFTQAATTTLGNHARLLSGNTALLWAGDANSSDSVIANGPSNDTNVVLGKVLTDPSNTIVNSNFRLGGYYVTDLNLDGVSLFAGPGNDINLLLGNVLLHPGNANFAANYILGGSVPR